MNTTNEMKLSFLSRSNNESFARVAVAAFFAQLDPTVDEMADIKTAVSEAVTNSIVHGYREKIGVRQTFLVIPQKIQHVLHALLPGYYRQLITKTQNQIGTRGHVNTGTTHAGHRAVIILMQVQTPQALPGHLFIRQQHVLHINAIPQRQILIHLFPDQDF